MVPTSPGELIDKLTILALKAEKMTDAGKLTHVRHEQRVLTEIADDVLPRSAALGELWDALLEINGDLWAIEDDIRACEARQDFGPAFVALARAVYITNDERAAIKKRINLLLESEIVEEKSYSTPGTEG
ncbi:hypothetical protein SAMN05444339_103362 [Loktanella atrilutea]|uniref:Uncharacterized protein n=2 Tax=Loktanella atrilutea TaxID=366533 RepID=A0A1M4Z425_LOKAT|nr:hypothetical protein SAMN05444339_103362 [Loktanella atrilutea]